ncbi:sulfide-dependent adenosine diphosphate thiazole synthase [Desulfohalovibrio reitneri]|uniref:sulfide-dependent adenosine diphosphate thiazole synthase n=1 Tax=Desulfohalovibrio reitneri TaxID=1307759 RepID=UPI0004A6C5B0|nr:sulfide-dependent adenosine diphosphate thiazole synthase [Desulfohalovibrio reitneri]
MRIEETHVSRLITRRYFEKFDDCLELDVAIVGGGPSGLTAAWKLAERGVKVALLERKLSIGGGMWGGGMCWNVLVVQEDSRHVLAEAGVSLTDEGEGYFTADAVEATTSLAAKACQAGTRIFNCLSVEDVRVRDVEGETRVDGLVINSSPVEMAGLHVDPLVIGCRYVMEATGHALEVLHTLVRKNGVRLDTPSGGIEGEKSMWAERAEATTPENTREIFPGVWVCGMAANASHGAYRMGPVFGGMLLSGEKAADAIATALGK